MIKKVLISLIISVLILLSFSSLICAEELKDEEMMVFNKVKEAGYSRIYVDLESEESVLKIDINEGDFISDISRFFVLLRDSFISSKYSLLLYDRDEKIFEISSKAEDIDRFKNNTLSEAEFFETLIYTEQSSIEKRLKYDIEILDFLVYGVRISEKTAEIDLIFQGENEDDIIADIANIHLLTLQYAPYIQETVLNLENHVKNEHLEFILKTENILSLLKNEIDYETYYDRAKISIKKDGAFLSGFRKTGTLDFIFVGIILIFGIAGLVKGFVISLFKLIGYIAGIIGAYLLSPVIVDFLKAKDAVSGFIHDRLYSSSIGQNILNLRMSSINELVPDNPVLEPLLKDSGSLLKGNVRIIDMLTELVLTGIITFILFVIIKVIISAIGKTLHNRIKGKAGVNKNRLLGFILGLVIGIFNISIIVMVVSPFIVTSSNSSIIEFFNQSAVLKKLISIIF
jgi:uncharacterized membrane protein required for colicin V production